MNKADQRTARLSRRPFPHAGASEKGQPGPSGGSPLADPRFAFLAAIWFGVLTGLLELLQLSVRNHVSGSVWLGILRMNRHFGWMIPAANALIFVAVGLVTALVVKATPGVGRWLVVRLPGFLAALALLSTVRGLLPIATFSVSAAIGHLLGRTATSRAPRLPRWLHASLPGLILLDVMLAGWCCQPLLPGSPAKPWAAIASTGEKRPNVLLVVLDTVRAENLSFLGYARATSPNLARLARRGVLFEQARSTAPWTFPSHASLFTGRWPHELNVGENRPLDGTYPTMAEALASLGYRTGGFVANTFFCNSWYGLGRGFDRYEDFYDDDMAVSWSETVRSAALGQHLLSVLGVSTSDHRVRKDAARINRDFLDWLSQEEGSPFFAFLNYFDAHSPYLLPDGEGRRLGTPTPDAVQQATLGTWEDRPKQNIAVEDTRLIRDAYDECLAYLDEQLGRLFDELERRGTLANTLVIVTSDHGEQLGEHGLYGHGKSLYGQETRVPLLIVPPRGVIGRPSIPEPVSLRDIPATVMDLLGARDAHGFPGASLVGLWTVEAVRTSPTSPAFSEVALRLGVSRNPNRPPAWRGPMRSLAVESRSYIHQADGTEQLFDLRADPREEHNLNGEPAERATLERLRRLLRSIQ